MKSILILLLFPIVCLAQTVDFTYPSSVRVDGVAMGNVADVKVNLGPKKWDLIGRKIVSQVRERCSDKDVPYATAKAQVAACEAAGLAIPAADKADLERRRP